MSFPPSASLRRLPPLATLLLAACTNGAPRGDAEPDAARRDTTSSVAGIQPMRQLLQEYNSGVTDSTRLIITDADSWANTWAQVYAQSGPVRPVPEVDFSREIVVLAALGTRATGGYTIRIDSARTTIGALEIFVRRIVPGPTCGTTAALTEPVAAVALPRTSLPPRFVESEEAADCG